MSQKKRSYGENHWEKQKVDTENEIIGENNTRLYGKIEIAGYIQS